MRFPRILALSIPLLLTACGSDGDDASAPGKDAATDSFPAEAGQDAAPDQGQPDSEPADTGSPDAGPDAVEDGPQPEAQPDSGPDATVEEQALQSYAEAFCDLMGRCAPFMVSYLYGDDATCIARYVAGGRRAVLPTASGVNKTAADVVSCATEMTSMTCAELYAGGRSTACPTIPGALSEGEDCFTDLQCASGFCDRAGACGTCAPSIGVGGACEFANDGCAAGLICHAATMADPTTCKASAGEGETCGASVICQGNMACLDGFCEQPGGPGDTCDGSTGSCNGLLGLRCSGGTCVAGTTTAEAGETCGLQGNTYVACKGTSYCDIATSKCVAKLADGSPCEPGSTNTCLYFASCENDVCTVDSEPTCP
jgi:hypothetical protein